MRKLAALLCLCMLFAGSALGEGHVTLTPLLGGEIVRVYESRTLDFSVERFSHDGARCYMTRIWVQDEAGQIKKGMSRWGKQLQYPGDMAKRLKPLPMVAINGSGFISPVYPDIPENYPGKNRDYFYTSWGSLVVTGGEVLRNLEGVPFYGVTLEEDGLHMYAGADNEEVLTKNLIHTWSFYDGCVLVDGDTSPVDETWKFAQERNLRTILGKTEDGNVFILTVTEKTNKGLSLIACADFLLEQVRPLWAFNLDGGPSSTLLIRPQPGKVMKTVSGNGVRTMDILGFCEGEEE